MQKIKNIIIDTNVLIDDPDALYKFDEHNVVIADVVLEELDKFKTEQSERGRAVKKVSRHLDELCKQGSLKKGVSLGEGKGIISLDFTPRVNELRSFKFDLAIADNRLLYLADKLTREKSRECVIVTKDINLRVKANSIGVVAEEYKNEDALLHHQNSPYMGRTVAYLPSSMMAVFSNSGFLDEALIHKQFYNAKGEKFDEPIFVNEFFELYSCDNPTGSCLLGRFDGKGIVPIRYAKSAMHGISPRNVGQHFMKEALLAPPEVAPLVIIKGIAGTGKTLFSLAAGLENYAGTTQQSVGRGRPQKKQSAGYNRILICRPSTTLDESLGYLPGTEEEKIEPYMRPIKDNVFTILHGDRVMEPYEYKQAEEEVNAMFTDDYIKTEALAFQRGRSLNHYWFILDEMQNSTRNQAKTVITRGGVGTKIILLGDPEQIDNPYLNERTNGLVYAAETMKGSPLCWQVTLKPEEGERSALAQEAAIRMK